ncbi:MAG: Ig-like domain-containing protein, partial [Mycobacterium sp.]
MTAPVTKRAIVTDVLSWIGLGSLKSGVPTPATPVSDLRAGLWVGVRRLHYTFHNSFPTLRPSPSTADPVTGVVTGNLGGADANDDVLTYAVSHASHGTVEIARDGTYTYTPDPGFAHTGGVDR